MAGELYTLFRLSRSGLWTAGGTVSSAVAFWTRPAICPSFRGQDGDDEFTPEDIGTPRGVTVDIVETVPAGHQARSGKGSRPAQGAQYP